MTVPLPSSHTLFKKYKARLKKLDTTLFCDVSEEVQVLNHQIHSLVPGLKMVGIAHTVESQGDLLAMFQALQTAQADEVLVVKGDGSFIALAGELMAREAKNKKLAGIVIDGGCRDVDMLPKVKLPFYAGFVSPKAGTRTHLGRTQITLTCGGVVVHPGDIVIGDDNGVIVIAPSDLAEIVVKAEARCEKEKIVLEQMHKGVSLLDMLNLNVHLENLKEGKNSSLTFDFSRKK